MMQEVSRIRREYAENVEILYREVGGLVNFSWARRRPALLT